MAIDSFRSVSARTLVEQLSSNQGWIRSIQSNENIFPAWLTLREATTLGQGVGIMSKAEQHMRTQPQASVDTAELVQVFETLLRTQDPEMYGEMLYNLNANRQ